MTYGEFIRQTNAFEGAVADRYSAFEMLLAEEMQEGGVDAFRNVLSDYNANAKLAQGGQVNMMTGRIATTIELKNKILEKYGKELESEPAAVGELGADVARGASRNNQVQSADASPQQSDGQEIESAQQKNANNQPNNLQCSNNSTTFAGESVNNPSENDIRRTKSQEGNGLSESDRLQQSGLGVGEETPRADARSLGELLKDKSPDEQHQLAHQWGKKMVCCSIFSMNQQNAVDCHSKVAMRAPIG